MASKRIQGITIEIGGDTSKLQSALKGVDTELRKTQGNLKDINKLLKLDPGNTELLVQKQKNLQESIKTTEERLKTLRSTQTDSLSPQEYDALQREIIDTEQHLKGLEDEYKSFGSVAQQKLYAAGEAMQDLGRKITASVEPAQEALKKFAAGVNEHVIQPIIKAGKVAVTAGATITTALTKGAVDAKAEYEQLVGGVNKLYGKAATRVIKNASKAYKTAGQSANNYMKTLTSFSASLITSMSGDTEKAAKLADMAIQDMSDNVNTFGKDFETIQSVYQSLAKEQYSTLDNLSLGYAGTKAGVEQLIRDAEKLDSTFQVTHNTVKKGKKVNDELVYSYGDIVQAIHIVQDNMNITGTTTREASTTIEGSLAQVKASWQNLLTAIGTGENVKGATKNVLESVGIYLKDNLLPTIRTALTAIPQFVGEVWEEFKKNLPGLTQKAINWLANEPAKWGETIKTALSELGYPIRTGLFTAIATASAALSQWIYGDHSMAGKFRNGFLEAKADIEEALENVGEALSTVWEEVKPFLKNQVKTFITQTLPKVSEKIKDISEWVKDLADKFANLDDEDKEFLIRCGEIILIAIPVISAFGKVVTAVGGLIKIISGVGGLISALTGPAGLVVAFAAVAYWVYDHWEDIKTAFEKGKKWVIEKIDVIKNKFGEFKDSIKSRIDNIKEFFENLRSTISAKFSWIKNNIPSIWSSFWSSVKSTAKNAIAKIKEWLSTLVTKINNALNKLDKFIEKNQQTKDTDKSKARTGDAHSYANDYGEGNISVPSFFAKGGTLNEGQSAIVGEYAPEYLRVLNGRAIVTPLTNQPARMGGDTTVNISINAQPGQSAEDIAAAVKRVFVREMEQRSAAYA